MFRYSFAVVLALAFTGTASAATWAESFFDETARDFGSVPRGPTLTYPFRIVNKTNSPVQISNVRVSCGCTSARALQTSLAPGQETAILIEMDTRRFSGPRSVTVYVQFNQPKFDEVRLTVTANSRDDITLAPESLAVGRIKRGTAAKASTTITFQGGQNWQITGVSSDSNFVQPSFEQVNRNGGQTSYQVTAAMRADTPAGKWFTDIWLTTNNPGVPRIRIPLTVEIDAPLSITPLTVGLGEVKAGQLAERKVVVRGEKAFRILSVQGTDQELTVKDSTSESKTTHVLTVALHPEHPGELQRTLRVLTDLEGEETIEFQAIAQVVK